MTQDAFPAFACSVAVAATAAERHDSLDGIDTSVLKSGSFGWVQSGDAAETLFRLDVADSATVPDGITVVQPLTGPGRWKAFAGGTINGQGNILTDTASATPPAGGTSLQSINTTIVPDGSTAYVRSVEDQYVLDKDSTLAADGITIVQPATGTGRWLRRKGTGSTRWRMQTSWHIDADNGSDEADGDAPGTALASWAELRRRLGSNPRFEQDVTVDIATDLSEVLELDGPARMAPGIVLTIRGRVKNTLQSGTLSGVTAQDRPTQQPLLLSDTGLGAHVEQRVRITSGAAAGATCWGFRSSAADDLECVKTVTYDETARPLPPNATPVTPSIGDDYEVDELIVFGGLALEVISEDSNAAVVIMDMDVVADSMLLDGRGAPGLPPQVIFLGARYQQDQSDGIVADPSRFRAVSSFVKAFTHEADSEVYDACLLTSVVSTLFKNSGLIGLTNDTIVSGGEFNLAQARMTIQGGAAVFDSGSAGINVQPGASVLINTNSLAWGDGNNSYGWFITADAMVSYINTQPTLTGDTDDARIGGADVSYAGIPTFDTATAGGIVQPA